VGFKSLIAATTSVALIAAPTMAAAQTRSSEVAPAAETVNGDQLRGGFIIPLIALIAIILGILAATHDDDGDLPHSP
jgi:hypothetical protein